MTLGQRIAQKRRELGLSQEALGDQLGLSRQSIYKWEADSSVPEIEKLIALSKLFGVSVGWLLGVEDDAPPQDDTAQEPQQAGSGELNETQLKMVEEIVARYLAAQSAPKKRRGWWYAAAAVAVIAVFFSLFSRLDQLNDRYSSLQNSVGNITYSVNSQIGGISNRVEEILKAQNALTAEYGSELVRMELADNAAVFSAWAVPKTYVEGMTAEFVADSDGELVTVSAVMEEGRKFAAEMTAPLSDNITVSVVFILPDGTRQTQLLDTYEYLFTGSFPELSIMDHLHFFGTDVVDGKLVLRDAHISVRKQGEGKGGARIVTAKLGLFRNQKLVAWAQPVEQPDTYIGFEDHEFYRLPDLVLENLTEEDVLAVAALVTDQFGREFMAFDVPYVVRVDTSFDSPYLTYPDAVRLDRDPEKWEFD
ncbi:MAG: helix-turn-helix domain-containing protein [Oscillospiraceae bacterium]|nr:helix-turn-helix domain-containing protein [Oscillospiraceae bacterium]